MLMLKVSQSMLHSFAVRSSQNHVYSSCVTSRVEILSERCCDSCTVLWFCLPFIVRIEKALRNKFRRLVLFVMNCGVPSTETREGLNSVRLVWVDVEVSVLSMLGREAMRLKIRRRLLTFITGCSGVGSLPTVALAELAEALCMFLSLISGMDWKRRKIPRWVPYLSGTDLSTASSVLLKEG